MDSEGNVSYLEIWMRTKLCRIKVQTAVKKTEELFKSKKWKGTENQYNLINIWNDIWNDYNKRHGRGLGKKYRIVHRKKRTFW